MLCASSNNTNKFSLFCLFHLLVLGKDKWVELKPDNTGLEEPCLEKETLLHMGLCETAKFEAPVAKLTTTTSPNGG